MDSGLNVARSLKKVIATLLNPFHEIEREETLPNSFYEPSITLILN
jgi:hypothetical protein